MAGAEVTVGPGSDTLNNRFNGPVIGAENPGPPLLAQANQRENYKNGIIGAVGSLESLSSSAGNTWRRLASDGETFQIPRYFLTEARVQNFGDIEQGDIDILLGQRQFDDKVTVYRLQSTKANGIANHETQTLLDGFFRYLSRKIFRGR